MRKIFLVFFAAAVFYFISALPAFCWPGQAAKAKHADKNQDGTVDRKEMRTEKQLNNQPSSRVNLWWEKVADKNNDGTVDAQEVSIWKEKEKKHLDLNNDGTVDIKERRTFWKKVKPRVDTPLEAQYDKNNNGWLGPVEAREMLQDRYELIKTNGKAKVDSSLEREYDVNGDGIIDANEAEAMQEDIKEGK